MQGYYLTQSGYKLRLSLDLARLERGLVMQFESYESACKYLEELGQFATGTGVSREEKLLKGLKNPESYLNVIHVAGTNGKGSCCAFLASCLRELNYKVGLFTSPHLVKINERIKINNEDINDEDFLDCLNIVLASVKEETYAYFDILMAVAMVYYKKNNVDFVVLETGLGGKLDATNAVKRPICSIITGVSLEHTAILGDTIEKIAREKAGIIKENVPLIFNSNDPIVTKVIRDRFNEINSDNNFYKIYSVNKEMYRIKETSLSNIDFFLDNDYYKNDCFSIGSNGIYQVLNSSLCLTALAVLANNKVINFDREAFKRGIKNTRWPGRMELVKENVFIDGGHNPEGIARFIDSVREVIKISDKKTKLLFSVVSDKDYSLMIKELVESDLFDEFYITVVGGLRKVSKGIIIDTFSKYTSKEIKVVDNAGDFINSYDEDAILFAVGSLYLVGEIKRSIN